MEMKLKKLWPLIGALCVSLFSSAHADNNYQYNGSSSQSNTMQQSGQGTYQRGAYREITPNAGPRVAHGADVFITADFIWWKAAQDGLDYAVTGVALDTAAALFPATGVGSQGKVHDVGFGWDPGFKVGLGLNLSHDGWDLFAQYTWLHSSESSSTSAAGITNAIPSVLGNINAFGQASRSGKWDLHFNVIDLELGRNFYVSQFLTMRPFFGLKGTWQNQDFTTTISSASFLANGNPVTGPYRSKQDHDVWGLGVRGGFNLAWYMSKSWSIFGNLAWSAMWTHYDVDRKDVLTVSDTDSYRVVNTELNNYRVRYVGELELGLRWEIWFYDDNYHFAIQAGWEEQVWVNYGNFIRLYNDVQNDLSLHGLNLKFRFDF